MSTNLRLSDSLAAALREASLRTGRSQQDIVRGALVKELGLASGLTAMERAVRAGVVEPPEPFQDVEAAIPLPSGMSLTDLLDREDR